MMLLGRFYQSDVRLFEMFLNKIVDGGELQIGPSFVQQKSFGGIGIPNAVIEQLSFKLIIETKLDDKNFWGKENYTSHFNNEKNRILLTLSKNNIDETRSHQIKTSVLEYDELYKEGKTIHVHLTFISLIENLREIISTYPTKYKFELEDMIVDFEGFATEYDLINDEHLRMHVFAINTSEEDNKNFELYYNHSSRNESPHKFVGLYRNKEVKYIAETKVVVTPTIDENKVIHYNVIKGEKNWNKNYQDRLEEFYESENWGFDGTLKFHLFNKLYDTSFKKISPGGIMAPRHFYLPDYIDNVTPSVNAEWVAEKLRAVEWE